MLGRRARTGIGNNEKGNQADQSRAGYECLVKCRTSPFALAGSKWRLTLVWSDYIVAEVERKMDELGWSLPRVTALIDALVDLAELVDYRQITGGNYDIWLRDPDDHPIMATALAGQVDYLITWNTRDFPPKQRFAGITVLTPDAFLRLLGAS